MVICGVVVKPEILPELKTKGVKDSKKISPDRRKNLAEFLRKKVEGFEFLEINPQEIDRLRSRGTTLNQIEADGFAELIGRLETEKVYVDSASANPKKFANDILNRLTLEVELVVEHEADKNYLPVSAASIMAKVRRDKRIEKLKKTHGNIGSGYPADRRTIQFLKSWMKDNQELPDFVRKSWDTIRKIKSESGK